MMDMNWKEYCKDHGIKWEYEGPYDVRFTAPRGKTFGNGCRSRLVEDIEQMMQYEGYRSIENILIYS
jgi:hypothetical protein